MLSPDEIKRAKEELERQYPAKRTGQCPFCKSLFAMQRQGGINFLGYRTPVYYVEAVEHECVILVIPKKQQEEWVVEQPRRRKKSRSEKIRQIGLFR